MDESGTHDDSEYVVVSATWATPAIWGEWTIDWLKAKSPIQVHHSTDCHNFKGEYQGWSRTKRDAYVQRILPTIGKHWIQTKIATLPKREFNQRLANRPDVRDWLGNTYFVVVMWALNRTWSHLQRSGATKISFIHETNQYQNLALDAFRFLQARYPGCSASLKFGSKLSHPPLQCADVFAFEGNRQMRDKRSWRLPLKAIDPPGMRLSFLLLEGADLDYAVSELISDYEQIQAKYMGRPQGG